MFRLRMPWRPDNACPLPPFTPRDRRRALRRALVLPVRLRLGAELFPGRTVDLGEGGVGLWLDVQPGAALSPDGALSGHEQGALEILSGSARFVVRVRVAQIMPARGGIHVGLAFDHAEEIGRLIGWLDDHGSDRPPVA